MLARLLGGPYPYLIALAVFIAAIFGAYAKGYRDADKSAELARLQLDAATQVRIAENRGRQLEISRSQALAEAQESREAEDLIATRLREIQASEKAAEAENSRLESQIAFLNAELTDATKDQNRTQEERDQLNAQINDLKSKLRSCGLSDRDIAADRGLHHKGSR